MLSPFGDGLFSLSPSFDFDAAALVEVERIEKNCFRSPETKTENAISSASADAEKKTPVCLVQDKEETSRISALPSTTVCPFVTQSPFTRRGRISTPIEDANHILVSPSDRSPAFSPVPLVFSHTPENGSTSSRYTATNIRYHYGQGLDWLRAGMVAQLVRSLSSDYKVPSSIPGSAKI